MNPDNRNKVSLGRHGCRTWMFFCTNTEESPTERVTEVSVKGNLSVEIRKLGVGVERPPRTNLLPTRESNLTNKISVGVYQTFTTRWGQKNRILRLGCPKPETSVSRLTR